MSSLRAQALLTAPNLLSLSRVPLGGVFWLALGPTARQSGWAFAVMALAALTDVLDGHLARRAAARAATSADGGGAAPDGPAGKIGGTTGAAAGSTVAAPPPDPTGGMGAWLDPICDKLFVAQVLGAIIVQRHPPWILILLIVSRELMQLPLALVYRLVPVLRTWLRYDFRASPLGKAATVTQFMAVGGLILDLDHPATKLLASLAFLLGMAALVDYVRRAVVIGRRRLASGPR